MPRILVGAGLMLASSTVAVLDAVIVRVVAAEVHPFEIVFFRNFFSLLVLLPFLSASDRAFTANRLWIVHGSRATLKLGALTASFLAVTMLPLSVVTAVAFTTPLFVHLGSILFLGERARVSRICALVAGFVGVVVVLRPTEVPLGLGAVLALASALGLAAVVLLLKFSSERESALKIVWLNLVITVPVAFLLCLPVWTTPSLPTLGLLALQGVGGLLAQLAVTRAMRMSDASLLVMIDFIRLPLAVLLGLALFGEAVELAVLVGGGIILAAIVLLLNFERNASKNGDPRAG